jgi:multiple sugar transport system ATP-binding protein
VGEGREPAPGDEGWALPRPGRVLLYRDGELVAAPDESDVPEPRMAPTGKENG